jgi:hypothetical protein
MVISGSTALNFQSRSLRHRDTRGIDAFPTPPSSASTPPTTTTTTGDEPPPRKRARLNPPSDELIDLTSSSYVEDSVRAVENEVAVIIPRIRIKMAENPEIQSTRRRNGDSEDEFSIEMETPQEPEETWETQEVREMCDQAEKWRVIGLSNVGNTCFTNAILQIFS